MIAAKAAPTVLILLPLLAPAASAAPPKAELWERWTAQDAASRTKLDHSAWDRFLARHVKAGADGISRVAYREVSAEDSARLSFYLQEQQRVTVSRLARAEQRAYWINLYNAVTVKTVLLRYPVESIRDIRISPSFFQKGPWGARLLDVEGEALTLDDIEHRILRPVWKDPRTHYALNCASLGCPNLAARAYTAANMEELLEAGARAYVNHPRGARVEGGELHVSSLYEWFKSDFGGTDTGVIAHLRQYADPPLRQALQGVTDIGDDEYDWALNDAR